MQLFPSILPLRTPLPLRHPRQLLQQILRSHLQHSSNSQKSNKTQRLPAIFNLSHRPSRHPDHPGKLFLIYPLCRSMRSYKHSQFNQFWQIIRIHQLFRIQISKSFSHTVTSKYYYFANRLLQKD